jgi:polyisoprenoid-binding protein YceI
MNTIWRVDPAHSEVQFKVKHLMLTTVTGYFRKFDLVVETEDEDFTQAKKIEFTTDASSIDTNSEQRDTHLRSADFFDVERFREIRFEGKVLERAGEDYNLTGDLTIRGVTKPFTVQARYSGIVIDPYGQTKAGFEVEGKISRKEFGLVWNGMTEAGQVVVSDDIRIVCEIQLVKQVEVSRNSSSVRAATAYT